jgi:hypothetical protein
LRQEFSARPKPETPCGASDCSSWPNERTEWIAAVADDTGTRTKKYGQGGTALSLQVSEWAAPQARDHFPPHSPERIAAMKAEGHGMRNLNDEAATWRAPSDVSKRGGSQPAEKRAAGGHSVNLEDQAEHWSSPPSSQDRPIAGGSTSSTSGPNSNQPSVKRKLNPIFVEALMRWPTGLSGFERQETAWTRWWLLMPSFVYQLVSQKPSEQGQLL